MADTPRPNDGSEMPCDECNGYGYLAHTNPDLGVRCPTCHGCGYVPTQQKTACEVSDG